MNNEYETFPEINIKLIALTPVVIIVYRNYELVMSVDTEVEFFEKNSNYTLSFLPDRL